LHTQNRFGRSGTYSLPAGYDLEPKLVVVWFHGTGSEGSSGVGHLRAQLSRAGLILVAPDSGRAPDGTATWQVADQPGETTADLEHTLACLREVSAMPQVRFSDGGWIAIGYSGGGSSAPYLASRDRRFEAYASLHGGVFAGGLGTHRVRGWFSTGSADQWRPPARVRAEAQSVGAVFKEFPGGHGLSEAEVQAVFEWWRGG
jgi:predicted esterase